MRTKHLTIIRRTLIPAGIYALALFAASALNALAPPYVSDAELARYPVIVVAKWDKTPWKPHYKYGKFEDTGEKVIEKEEYFTELEILRVIKGDVKPGLHKLKIGYGLGWDKDGEFVSSGTSTDMSGDVSNASEPNIWFLKKTRSWDENDKTEYLSASNYRELQPLPLERFYAVLGGDNPKEKIPKFLDSKNSEEVSRALEYVFGYHLAWPYNSRFDKMYNMSKTFDPLPGAAEMAAKVIARKDLKSVRVSAMTIYASLKGAECADYVRQFLADEFIDLRGMAVCILAHYKDEQSIDDINNAVPGITKCHGFSHLIIDTIREWGDIRLTPALISFLDTNQGFQSAASGANDALFAITGARFPYSVNRSMAIWKKIADISNPKEQREALKKLLEDYAVHLEAELCGSPEKAFVRITNKSKHAVAITSKPSGLNLRTPRMMFSGPFETDTDSQTENPPSQNANIASTTIVNNEKQAKFVILKPGKAIDLPVKLNPLFLVSDPAKRKMTIKFDQLAKGLNVASWVGNLEVKTSPDWRENRITKKVKKTWPNGNLKTVGQTTNGTRCGKWEFFNEQGDRVKIVDYDNGTTATCNAEHPDNKGAGIIHKNNKD